MSTQNTKRIKTVAEFKDLLSIHVNSKGRGRLTEPNIIKILELYNNILRLKKEGIDTDNYNTKAEAYANFAKKAFDEYGQVLGVYPFKNPKDLFLEIHTILLEAKLTPKQIRKFYDISEVRLAKPTSFNIETYMGRTKSEINKDEATWLLDDDMDDKEDEWKASRAGIIKDSPYRL